MSVPSSVKVAKTLLMLNRKITSGHSLLVEVLPVICVTKSVTELKVTLSWISMKRDLAVPGN